MRYQVFMMGGVGNQLFQIARAVSLDDLGHACELISLRGGSHDALFRLIGFTKHHAWLDLDRVAMDLEVVKRDANWTEILRLALIYIRRRLGWSAPFNRLLPDNHRPFGSGIDVGYFLTAEQITENALRKVGRSLISQLNLSELKSEYRLGIHVRGLDSSRPVVTKDSSQLLVRFAMENALPVYVCSDDITLCRRLFDDNDLKIQFSQKDAVDDFRDLVCSEFLCISDSTFGFWVAVCKQLLFGKLGETYSLERWQFGDLLNEVVKREI